MGDKLKMIPLCQLQRSKINVRKTEPLIDIGHRPRAGPGQLGMIYGLQIESWNFGIAFVTCVFSRLLSGVHLSR